MKRYVGLLIMIGLLLSLVAPLTAQQATPEPTPEAVGLRPDAPTYALRGPYWVGTMGFEAVTPSHPTKVTLWYPALNFSGEPENVSYAWDYFPNTNVSVAGHALQDAAPNTRNGPYPFVILVHGLEASRLAFTYLGEHLASQGFVVMSIDYIDNARTAGTIPVYEMLFTRPKDVSWEIDQAFSLTASGEKLEGVIDTEHIALVGHSLGGTTVLASAGAQMDLAWFQSNVNAPIMCVKSDGSNSCAAFLAHQKDLADLAGLKTIPDKLWPSWGDPRVDAIVGLSPSGGLFGPDGSAGVTIPTMLMVGSNDSQVAPELEVHVPYEHVGSINKALITFQNADHMIYWWKCSDGPWMVDFGAHWVCSDPVWDMDRTHDLVDHFTTAFLLDVLKGNKDAAAALAPDAVSFPGITYQAQGF